MNTQRPSSENSHGNEAELFAVPQVDVVGLARPVAQQMIEGTTPHTSTDKVFDAVSLTDMAPEQLTEWLGANNIHNGAQFMSPEDNAKYQELCQTDLKEAIKYLRDMWDIYADHDFINGFALVHWVGSSEDGLSGLEKLVGDSRHEVEISTQGYRDNTSLKDTPRWRKAKFGVLINGKVTLASNEDIQTNQWHNLQEDDVAMRRKYTEWANRLMTNQENCVSPYEFAVGDWKAAGVVVDPDTPDIDKVIALAKTHGLPVIDTQNNTLFTPRVDVTVVSQ